MSRAKVTWSTGCIKGRSQFPVRRAFIEWHRAHLLGLKVTECEFGGVKLTEDELFRLNLWISAQGAWRCSLLPYPEATKILRSVLLGGLRRVSCGSAGAGRWATWPKSASVFCFDLAEGGEEQLGLDLGEHA